MYDAETYEHEGIPVRIVYDDTPENPYKAWSNASEILSDVHDYDLGEAAPHPESAYADTPSSAVMQRWLTLFGGYSVAIPWTFQDYGSSGARAWLDTPDDEPAHGWLVMSREKVAEEFGGDAEAAERCARGEFESFRAWIEGEVFGYIVAEDSEDEESVWGFYGDISYVKEEANEAAAWIARERWTNEEPRDIAEILAEV